LDTACPKNASRRVQRTGRPFMKKKKGMIERGIGLVTQGVSTKEAAISDPMFQRRVI